MRNEKQRELAFLFERSVEIREQLERSERLLDEYEQIHLQKLRYGVPHGRKQLVERYLEGGYEREIENYKSLIMNQYRVSRRLYELTNGEFL